MIQGNLRMDNEDIARAVEQFARAGGDSVGEQY